MEPPKAPGGGISISPLLDHPLETTKEGQLRLPLFGNTPRLFSFQFVAFGPYFVTALGSGRPRRQRSKVSVPRRFQSGGTLYWGFPNGSGSGAGEAILILHISREQDWQWLGRFAKRNDRVGRSALPNDDPGVWGPSLTLRVNDRSGSQRLPWGLFFSRKDGPREKKIIKKGKSDFGPLPGPGRLKILYQGR